MAKAEKKERRRRIGAEEFIVVWQTSANIEEVALRLHKEETIPASTLRYSLSNRASSFRIRGIPLKRMKEGMGARKLDIESLSNLARELEGDVLGEDGSTTCEGPLKGVHGNRKVNYGKVESLWRSGVTDSAIAEATETTSKYVKQIRSNHGWLPGNGPHCLPASVPRGGQPSFSSSRPFHQPCWRKNHG